MQNNPLMMMQQLSSFMSGYHGNPQEEATQKIQQAGLNQQQLNQLQQQANQIYSVAKNFGLIK